MSKLIPIVERVIEAAGGGVQLARHLGITRQAFYRWRQIPASRVIPIEAAIGGQITRYEMRPDIYPENMT